MQNDKFRRALAAALIPEYINSIPQMQPHEFSPEFERKMNRLIRRQRKPYFKLINTVGKRAACIAVCIIIAVSATALTSEAVREKILSFFVNTNPKNSSLTVESDTDAPDTIEEIYAITYDLSDYEIYYEEYNETKRNIVYQKDDVFVNFTQYTKERYENFGLNTEGAPVETIMINDYEAIYFGDNHNYHHLVFNNGDYIFYILTNIDKNELIDIAASVQKVE